MRKISRFLWLSGLATLGFACSSDQSQTLEHSPANTPVQDPLFTLLDPQESGLYFVNELRENEKLNILTYEYLYNGGGVAVGDVNNDGWPDVFMVGNLFGGRLYLNKGNLQFEQISEKAGVFVPGFSTGVSMVDINEDGFLDIYICRSLADQPEYRANVLLINNGDSTFTDRAAEYGLADQGFSNHANFFDYDRDGDLDLYLLNHRADFEDALTLFGKSAEANKRKAIQDRENNQYVTDRLYRNNGDGSFSDVTDEAGVRNHAFGLSVTVSDLNGDGWTDLFVANDYADRDHLYINNANGTFTDRIDEYLLHTSKNAMGSDIADFNNDGLPDIINLDMVAGGNYRQKQLKGPGNYDGYHMAVNYGLGHQVMRNTLQLNNGDGTFSEIAQLAGVSHTDWSWAPLLADLNNDGWKDLFISNGYYRDVTDMDYLKYESNKVLQSSGGMSLTQAFDLVQKIQSTSVANYVFENRKDLTFTDRSVDWGIDSVAFSQGTALADLDRDGDLDLITNNLNSPSFLYRNNSRERFPNQQFLAVELDGPPGNVHGFGARVTVESSTGSQVQECTPYRGFFSSMEPRLHFGLGERPEAVAVLVQWPDGRQQVTEQVALNETLVLHWKDAGSAERGATPNAPLLAEAAVASFREAIYQEDNFIDFKREPLLEHQLSNKGPFLAQADVNGDGLEDVYLSGAAGQSGAIYFQSQGGNYKLMPNAAFAADLAFEDGQAVFFDADGDGDQDLYVVSGGYAFPHDDPKYQDRLYRNDGKGTFKRASEVLPEIRENGTCVIAGDVDADGDVDLFVGGGTVPGRYPECEPSFLLINEGGTFKKDVTALPKQGLLGMINAASWLENTGELIVAGEWMPITVLRFVEDAFQEVDAGLAQTSGWWNVLQVADLDGDGDLDVVAGNRGTNNFFSATPNRPAELIARDFDENGSLEALPFYAFPDGQHYPKHVLDEVFAQYPGIRRKCTRYKQYSRATLDSLFTAEELEGATKLTAHTFASSWFENRGDGTYKQHELPKRAQFSEVHGILISRVNGDAFPDLILTGNNYGSDVVMGKSDASVGVVLIRTNQGEYAALSPAASGLNVPGDSRGIYRLNDQQFMVLRNGAAPLVFEGIKP